MLSQVAKFATDLLAKRDKLIITKGDKGGTTFILDKDDRINIANKLLNYNSITK